LTFRVGVLNEANGIKRGYFGLSATEGATDGQCAMWVQALDNQFASVPVEVPWSATVVDGTVSGEFNQGPFAATLGQDD
jgi:hypothetical protein|tara:strand:+ start:2707 stop:2943 length:237 start_codon:yes stop_codon:yes gene_type:complete